MNTLVYADVAGNETSDASTIAATGQQLAISFGVAGAAVIAALFVPAHLHSHPAAVCVPRPRRAHDRVVGRLPGAEGR